MNKGIFLKEIIENVDSKQSQYFALFIQFLIIVSLITFSLETLPALSIETKKILNHIERVIIVIFSIEYLLRIYVSERKFGFIFSFFGLVDFISILPFYISTGGDLRSVRAFRLLRLFRILKLFRYNGAIRRFHRALVIAKEELVLFSFVALILLYLSAVGIYYFEHIAQPEQFKSVFHSLWWAITTLTTVGYGDVFPITIGGRIFTFFVLMLGLGIVAVPTGLISSALSQARREEKKINEFTDSI